MTIPKGYFKAHYQTEGNPRWLREIDPADLAAFVRVGQVAHGYGRLGGKARAATAVRNKGRFARKDGTLVPYEEKMR